jgi:hypothetical protein
VLHHPNGKKIPTENLLQHGAMQDATSKSITCLQHQNKSTATSEQGDYNNRTKLLQCEMQDQKKKTNATKKYYLLQHTITT